MDCIN